ncbi:MFS transporter [Aeromonas tecta]|uniref:MFS transporter n=1 Tax=Aeromonas tecta TaxID=324617 RepID=UPI000683444E|nr:MFS transporter [Aeromonas tecta]
MQKEMKPFASVFVLNSSFFIWGVITALTSVSVPYIKEYYDLSNAGSGLIPLIFFIAPFIASLPMGRIMIAHGYRKALTYSYWLALLGSITIIVAYHAHHFPMLCLGVLFIALAVAAMQVVANPYLATLGTAASVPGRLSLASAINSLGTVVAPLSAALMLGSFYDLSTSEQSARLTMIYVILLAFIGGLILLSQLVKLPDVRVTEARQSNIGEEIKALASHKLFTLSVLAIFFYVGAEVAIAVNAVIYISDPNLGGFSLKEAASLISLYWAGAMVGRVLYGLLSHKVNLKYLIAICTAMPAVLILLAMLLANEISGYLFLLIGITNSVIYPVIYSIVINNTPKRLLPMASAILIMAGLGGAVIPFIQACVSDFIGVPYGFLIPLVSYLYLFHYAMTHHRHI